MIAEAVDTAFTIGWAIVAWIVLTAAAATLALYTLLVTVWTVCRLVWRVGRAAWRVLRKRQTGVCGAESASCDSPDANTPQKPAQKRTAPSWARDEHDHQEAA